MPDIFQGRVLPKLLILAAAVILGAVALGGFGWNPLDIFWTAIKIGIGLLFIFLAYKGIATYMKEKAFSPQATWKEKLTSMCKRLKPFNVQALYLRGEDMRISARFGKIIGLGFIPYFQHVPKRDHNNDIIYKKNPKGEPLLDNKENPIPEMEILTDKDGDIVFIVPKKEGLAALLNKEVDIIRANPKYVSELLGTVYIKDVSLVPYGDYLFPAKQMQDDIRRIMKQAEAETVITTHQAFLDLVATYTDASLGANPAFQMLMHGRTDTLQSTQMGGGGITQ